MTRLVKWLLWSRRRALVGIGATLAVVLVTTMVGSYVREYLQYQRDLAAYEAEQADPDAVVGDYWWESIPNASAAPSPSPSSLTDDEDPAAVEDPAAAPAPAAGDPEAVATDFVTTWLTGATAPDRAAWLTEVKAMTDPGLHAFLNATGPEAIPSTEVTGAETASTTDTAAAVTVTLADGTSLIVGLVSAGQSWQVTDYGPNA